MEISESARNIWNAYETLPKWGGRPGCYFIDWKYPDFYNKHIEKISQCPRLQQEIVELCQIVLDSGVFDIDWVELQFYTQGLIIDVPGNACGIYPDTSYKGSYGSHNIDTLSQIFSLYFFFITASSKIYSYMVTWEDDPTAGVEGMPVNRSYRLKRKLESKRFEYYEIRDYDLNTIAIAAARTSDEAREIAQKADFHDNVFPVNFTQDYPLLSNLKIFKVSVSFEDSTNCNSSYQVLAANSYHAKQLVQEHFENTPSLFPIKGIKATKDGEIPLPRIL